MYCVKCETEKPDTDFYPSQKSECKDCTRLRVRTNRRLKKDYYREYDRKRGNRQSGSYLKKYRKSNPERYKAHNAVNNAVRDGRLAKEPCFMCGDENVVGHHVDYDKPLEVIWLCHSCHKLIHAYEDKASEIRASAQTNEMDR